MELEHNNRTNMHILYVAALKNVFFGVEIMSV